MMLTRLHGRRALLGAFASVVLARAWRLAPGRAVADEARDKAMEDKGPGKADGEAKKGKGVVLTIVVMGDGKKIQQAEVQVRFSASAGGACGTYERAVVAMDCVALGRHEYPQARIRIARCTRAN